ncbi:hypothetical protein BP5796_11200 [Coleophoma crateriformis]|uniref:GH64 domain-containing protein n=1 Tax=Coleophoma crateriformis TaxID=565419 RepID=A0A3D8QHY4_9HELO|nr:hypothetical protein BP5796_11200 [Coleophoma crateriformis]
MGFTRKIYPMPGGDLIIDPADLKSLYLPVAERETAAPTTVDDSLKIQTESSVLAEPIENAVVPPSTLRIGLYNSTSSSTVYAYITGLSLSNNNAVCMMESDGSSVYYPSNPTTTGVPLSANCAIPLGAPGSTTWCTIPLMAGGRIWFCIDDTLTFLLNPGETGPGLVEPSVSNTSDPNYYKRWDYCEFTFNAEQLFANITYVDFVCLPIALTLTSTSGVITHVSGMASDGLDTVCANLITQGTVDGAGWEQLVVTNNGSNLRALSPLNGIVFNSSLFLKYFTAYIASVWEKYATEDLTIDTQGSWGSVQGTTSSGSLTFGDLGSFSQPSAQDIFSGSSGAFAAQAINTAELLAIGARLDAALNRGTLLSNSVQPNNEIVSTYYTNAISNQYAKIVHAANLDGKGYAFPYDDVAPYGGIDQSGEVNDPNPSELLVTVGGANAYARMREKRGINIDEPPMHALVRRQDLWSGDLKQEIRERDLERGAVTKLQRQHQATRPEEVSFFSMLPAPLRRVIERYLPNINQSPFTGRLIAIPNIICTCLSSFLSLSIRTIIFRLVFLLIVLLFWSLGFLKTRDVVRVVEQPGLLENTSIAGLERWQNSP